MYTHRMNCPTCRNVGDFRTSTLVEIDIRDPEAPRRTGIHYLSPEDQVDVSAVSSCNLCHAPAMLILRGKRAEMDKAFKATRQQVAQGGLKLPYIKFELVRSYPPAPTDGTSSAYSERINEGLQNLYACRSGGAHPSAILSTCRSILDKATGELLSDESVPKTFQKRINRLRERGDLTEALAAFAHEVRLEGNAAVHEIDGNAEDADDLEAYLHQFLDLTYGLPARIKARKQAI